MKSKQVFICIILLLAFVILFAVQLQNQKGNEAISASRDGSSPEKAIIIKYIGDYDKSIDQEYQYLKKKFGIRGNDWNLVRQSLMAGKEGKSYDEMIIELLPSKETITLYFDITEPFEELSKQFSFPPK